MWIIKKNDRDIIGDWKSCQNDIMDIKSCLFRGPNLITWYHFYPTENLMLLSDDTDTFTLIMGDGKGGQKFTIYMRIDSILWSMEHNCLIIRFIPDAYYHALSPIVIGNSADKNISATLKTLFPSNVDVVVSKDVDDMKLYNGFYHRGRIIDYIAKFCADNDREFYINDGTVAVGLIEKSTLSGDIPNIKPKQNTFAQFNKFGKKISMFVVDEAVRLPGSMIKLQNNDRRIIYNHTYCTKTTVTTTVLCTEREVKITEYILAGLLSDIMKDDMIQKILVQKSQEGVFAGKTKKDEEFIKEVYSFNNMRDMTNLDMSENSIPYRVVKSSPYAGDTVGIQYPLNDKSFPVMVSNEGERSSIMEVGQLWQKSTAPTRGDPNDYRLTLPDGGSIYYNNATGEMILAAKSKIRIGTQSDVSSESVPNPTEYIEIDGDGDTMTFSKNGATIEIDASGNINVTAKTGQNVNVDGTTVNIDGSTSVNINGTSPAAARKGDFVKSTMNEDSTFWTPWETFFTAVAAGPLPEPGNGAPSMFQTALVTLANAMQSTMTGKITGGSSKTNIG